MTDPANVAVDSASDTARARRPARASRIFGRWQTITVADNIATITSDAASGCHGSMSSGAEKNAATAARVELRRRNFPAANTAHMISAASGAA